MAVIVVFFFLAVRYCEDTARIAFPLSCCSTAGFRVCPFLRLAGQTETSVIGQCQVLLDTYIESWRTLNTLARMASQSFAFLELNERMSIVTSSEV